MSQEFYSLLLKQAESLISGESDFIANAANLSSLIFNNLDDVNWAGFYLFKGDELVLGPFCGQPACTRIPVGQGVCGTAFAERRTLRVDDVHSFAGHIACDAASESEIVVPFKALEYQGVLDIDSPKLARFSDHEQNLLEAIVDLFQQSQSK